LKLIGLVDGKYPNSILVLINNLTTNNTLSHHLESPSIDEFKWPIAGSIAQQQANAKCNAQPIDFGNSKLPSILNPQIN